MIGLLAVIMSLPIGNQANASAYKAAELGTLGGANSYANAINDNSTVVGSSQATDGRAYATLWQEKAVTKLELTSELYAQYEYSWASDINNVDQIVGGYDYSDYFNHDVLWSVRIKQLTWGARLALLQ